MINLLPPERKKQMQSARSRVFALKLFLVIFIIAACSFGIFGINYYSANF